MMLGGWLIMLASIVGITVFFAWCVWRILSLPGSEEHLHGFEVETPDHDT